MTRRPVAARRALEFTYALLAATAMLGAVLLASAAVHAATITYGPPEGSVLAAPAVPHAVQEATGLTAAQVAIVVNTADPLSVAVGDYYARRRRIPKSNVIRVSFEPGRDELPQAEFTKIRSSVESRVPAQVQVYALTWARPYRVACMSITTAFAFGADPKFCAAGCNATQPSPYFNATTSKPHDDLNMRPAMSIAALDFAHAKALIDRGVQSDGTMPVGTAYLVATDDKPRNVRSEEYAQSPAAAQQRVKTNIMHAANVSHRDDVMFYFIGAAVVPDLGTNRFLPGAIADHLTSFGGMLQDDTGQMSSLRWLEAGATGSYGTVIEPCNYLTKFPNVNVAMSHYLSGETLIEAYWKSVAMPGQGLFIGEPLAAPYRSPKAKR